MLFGYLSFLFQLTWQSSITPSEREGEGVQETDMLRRLYSHSPPSPHLNLQLQLQLQGDVHVLNASTERSYHLHPPESKKASGFSSVTSLHSNGSPRTKSSEELMNEIATLEIEIMNLECYLLSLYRIAFEEHLPILLDNHGTHLQNKTESPLQDIVDQLCYKMQPDVETGGAVHHNQTPHAHCSDNQSHAATPKACSTKALSFARRTVHGEQLQDQKSADSGHHRSLADHLGASCIELCSSSSPERLSQDIIKCISSIYCKLAKHSTSTNPGFSISSTSSLSSSSSTFSPRNLSDSWSSHCNKETTMNCQVQRLKAESGPYVAMMEVVKICLDDDSFNYAARMLLHFRSLVKSLEKVDPRKMKREEKLAFWINIHNALVMHAFLAYGTHNYVGSTSILKATYNVGGHFINACVIQSSILGIRPHYSAPWLQTLLSPGKKCKVAGSARHAYAIEYPEPLVHFALCSGAYSDPVVRMYTAKNVFQDLKLAKEEFVRAGVYIHKETKLFLPKILCYFAKDMSLTVPGLLQVVNVCLSQFQQESLGRCCTKGRPDKYIHWLPQSSTFRYLIHGELASLRIYV